ncbi:hypothetical protein [Thermofilum pendens]|uniref:hypothetical protein n=1 Tax=Thermofilum pendens TaxID=2269 RepID=UPI0011E51E5F|nr:hypothetical protein [Thermofilum pendens]
MSGLRVYASLGLLALSVPAFLFPSIWLVAVAVAASALALALTFGRRAGLAFLAVYSLLYLLLVLLAVPLPLYALLVAVFTAFLLSAATRSRAFLAAMLALAAFLVVFLALQGYFLASWHGGVVKVAPPSELASVFSRSPVILVGHRMAEGVAETRLSPNERIAEWEQIVVNATPYWVFAVTPLNTMSQNYVSKLILVNALTGEALVVEARMPVGSGLWLWGNIDLNAYLRSGGSEVGNTFPVIHGGKPYFVAGVHPLLGTVPSPGYLYVYDSTGNPRVYPAFSRELEDWPQSYDWEYLDRLVGTWLYHLAGLEPPSFTPLPRGFLFLPASPYSQNLLNMTLLVPDARGHTQRVWFGVSPASPNALASIVVANNTGVYYFDVRNLGIYSPHYVQSLVQSRLPAISGGTLYARYSQLLWLNGTWLWVTPVYAKTGVTTLWGVAVTNATNPTASEVYQYPGGDYQAFLKASISAFLSWRLRGAPAGRCAWVNGTVTGVYQFVHGGETNVAIVVGGKPYLAKPSMGVEEFLKALEVKPGQRVWLCVAGNEVVEVKIEGG